MAKLQRQNKGDFMSRRMDERVAEIEERLTALYANATNDAQSRLTDFLRNFESDDNRMRSRLEAGAITRDEYTLWRRNTMLQSLNYQATVNTMTNTLVETDVAAMALVNGELPYVVAQSYNFGQFVGSVVARGAGVPIGSFQIYNAQSVQAMLRNNPGVLPTVNVSEDRRWNRDRINAVVTRSIVTGDTIPQAAERLSQVTGMDRNSAIRNARTAITSAENLGRNEAFNYMRNRGVEMVKEWSAVYDDRTRDTHMMLDGTRANEEGYFGEGILDPRHLMQYPADPNGEAKEVYNCRCRLNLVPPEYSREVNQRSYESWLSENYREDYDALNEIDYFNRFDKTSRTAESNRRR